MESFNSMKEVAIAFVLFASFTRAWSINGHLYVANIAQDLLEENAPDSLTAANQMLSYFAEYDPTETTHED